MIAHTLHTSDWRAGIKRLRRLGRTLLNRGLTTVVGTDRRKRAPLALASRRILVVRVNKRLGNILFLTPMLQALHAGLPTCTIDVLIRDEDQRPLLANLPGVRNVYTQPHAAYRLPGLLFRLRRQHYDLVIDPSVNSTGNRLAAALVGARQRLGFAGPDQWLRLTHAAAYPRSRHQAQQAVGLLAAGLANVPVGAYPHLHVQPSAPARQQATQYWQQALGDAATTAPVIGFFTRATGAKQLRHDWWLAWLAALRERAPAARFLQIHPPGLHQPLAPDIPGVQIKALDVLAAVLGKLTVFVAADSGPMHLAAASGAPTIGLFQATSATAYAPLGANCHSIDKHNLTPQHAATVTLARLPAAPAVA